MVKYEEGGTTMKKKNVFVSSVSSKIPLLSCLKESIPNHSLIGGDSSGQVVSRFFLDGFWEMPSMDQLTYEVFFEYCRAKGIQYIIPTREGELPFFAKWRERLLAAGIQVMVSSEEAIRCTSDKLVFATYLEKRKYPVIPTSTSVDSFSENIFVVKERYGSGSSGVYLNVSRQEVDKVAQHLQYPIIQPFIQGREYSIDVYVTADCKAKGAVVRERVVVVNGESQVTSTIRNEQLEQLAMEVAETLHLYGHIMFQVIVDEMNQPHIVECNPRFGGASTLSVRAGLDSFRWFIAESDGGNLDTLPFQRVEKSLTQVRFAKDLII